MHVAIPLVLLLFYRKSSSLDTTVRFRIVSRFVLSYTNGIGYANVFTTPKETTLGHS